MRAGALETGSRLTCEGPFQSPIAGTSPKEDGPKIARSRGRPAVIRRRSPQTTAHRGALPAGRLAALGGALATKALLQSGSGEAATGRETATPPLARGGGLSRRPMSLGELLRLAMRGLRSLGQQGTIALWASQQS